ncbi:MAG: PLP-dependent aminotransferase family protein [Armatimonadetes bacterium]|nr:PLP-dependent aminotransferase family protein [Akkermansiaceae bacterium]
MERNSNQPLYLRIAERMEAMIDAGSLRAGDRIPSIRHSSVQHQVSIPTVMQAYSVLESRRLIEARPKSGFYVRPRLSKTLRQPVASKRKPSVASLAAFASVLSVIQDVNDPSLVPLGAAVPGDELLPMKKLGQLTSALIRKTKGICLRYDPVPGCLLMRKELSKRSLDWGCGFDAGDFVITLGASEALHLALLAVTRPGDTVLVESPTYYGTLNLLAQLKLKVIAVPASSGDGLDMNAVKEALNTHTVAAMLVIPNFSNPIGSLMPLANRRELLELAEKHGIPIIEDDIYGDLPHEGPRPHCLKSLDQEGRVILCGSFSKTLAPGFRVGYIVAGKFQQRVMELKNAFNLGGPPLPGLTIAEFLRTGGYERHLRRLCHTYRHQVCKMRETVAEAFPEGTKLSNPSGGFVLWLELPRSTDVLAVFREARATGISFAPGPLFSPNGSFKNCMRLSCGSPWTPRIESALGSLAGIVRTLQSTQLT